VWRTRRNGFLLVAAVGAAAALASTVPLLADDRTELTLVAAVDTTATSVPQDGDNSAKSTLATCPALCDRNPRGWRDAVVTFDVSRLPAGATAIEARLRLYTWQSFTAVTTAHLGGTAAGTGIVGARPALGPELDRSGTVRPGWNTWDVSTAVTRNGTYTFTVRQADHATRIYWASRENRNSSTHPQLVLSYRTTGGGTVTTAPTTVPPAVPPSTEPAPKPSPSGVVGSATATPTATPTGKPSPTGSTSSPATGAPAGWKLAWADEFDGTKLDTSKWQARDNTMVDYDLACITSDQDNIFVKGGTATLRVRKEQDTCGSETRGYTTAYLTTQGRKSFTYGRFEVRAKSPTGPSDSTGLWPAFWLRPDDGGKGEIDVVELPGGAKYYKAATQAIFYDYTPIKQDHRYPFPSGHPADGFHTYTTEWEPGVLRWYVDGVLVYQRDRSTTPWFDEAFSRPFHLRLNFQVGGWLGNPDAATRFPADFQVDYIRVWNRK
jgi:beta-glucanase (GH16 family)